MGFYAKDEKQLYKAWQALTTNSKDKAGNPKKRIPEEAELIKVHYSLSEYPEVQKAILNDIDNL
jgi:hypothetical protein